jgi:hypothetical protein
VILWAGDQPSEDSLTAPSLKDRQSRPRRDHRYSKPFRSKPKPEGYVTGRPTLYKPEYCQAVIDCMAQGYDLTAFAGTVDVARETVYDWIGRFPEFRHAVNIARAKRLLALQTKLLTTKAGVGVTAAIFALKNAAPDEWQDRYYTETKVNVSIDQYSDADLLAIIARADTPALIEAKPVEPATDPPDTGRLGEPLAHHFVDATKMAR